MAVTKTPRFSLPQWSAGTDAYPGRVGFNEIHQLLEDQAAVVFPSGPVANRPRSGTFGRFFLATDQGSGGRLYYDGGGGWIELNTNGGGGPGAPVVIGGSGSEGSSDRSARSDHTHTLALATTANHGAMASQWVTLLEGATMQAASNTLALRDSAGRLTAAYPNSSVTTSVATVGYINTRLGSTSNGTWDNIANTPAVRGADGTFYVSPPVKGLNPATKTYVDGKVSRAQWKTNTRPIPYGLAELRRTTPALFDYRDDADVPAEARGATDVIGSMVAQVHAVMPLLTIPGEDGEPERIKDRELIWVVVEAIRELAAAHDRTSQEIAELRGQLGLD